MGFISAILWAVILLLVWYFLVPNIMFKWSMWTMSQKFKKMAKGYEGDTAEQMNKIANDLRELGRNHKLLGGNDEED